MLTPVLHQDTPEVPREVVNGLTAQFASLPLATTAALDEPTRDLIEQVVLTTVRTMRQFAAANIEQAVTAALRRTDLPAEQMRACLDEALPLLLAETDPNRVQEELADLRGCMVDGYDEHQINQAFIRIQKITGRNLVCIWDRWNDAGPNGNSQFYLCTADGRLYETQPTLWLWLSADPADPSAPADPGEPRTWAVSKPDPRSIDAMVYSDGIHNYSRVLIRGT